MALAASIVAAFVAAAAMPSTYRRAPRVAYLVAIAVAAVAFLGFAWVAPQVVGGAPIRWSATWIPALGVNMSLRLDGLSLVFALAITGVGAIVLAYTAPYDHWEPRVGRLLGLLLAFLGAMLGLVLADDAITMFVFWELTSIVSFFLIAIHDGAEDRAKARQALLVTSGAGLALLVGLVLLARAVEPAGAPAESVSASLAALATADVRAHPHYAAIVILVAIGAFAKSAQFPLHFWLPGAMVAPTPVSAYLHSATMVKAGVYVLARLHPSLGGTALWTGLLGTFGLITFVLGALLAILQRDLKLALAYATISILGALTFLIGLGTSEALVAAVVLLVAHMAYKATLFLAAGTFSHVRGTRDAFAGPGAMRELPITAMAALIAAASMAGVPPLLGFIAKDAVFLASSEDGSLVVLVVSVAAGTALVTCAWLVAYAPFFRAPGHRARWRDAPLGMLVGPVLLALAGLGIGVAPGMFEPIARSVVASIAGEPTPVSVELWPGLEGAHGLAFALGLGSIVLGSLGYLVLARLQPSVTRLRDALDRVALTRAYDLVMTILDQTARASTNIVQHGRLRGYVTTTVTVMVFAVGLPLVLQSTTSEDPTIVYLGYELPLALLAVLGVLAAAVFRDRYAAIASLAITGFAVAFLFALFSGPDLAITQLAVESMTLILLVLVVRGLPERGRRRPQRAHHQVSHAAVAAAAGIVVSTLLLVTTTNDAFPPDAALAHIALTEDQHASNVVNTELVNFRAIDTLGEISVLAMAGLGTVALMRRRRA